jgi:hypothetical protein
MPSSALQPTWVPEAVVNGYYNNRIFLHEIKHAETFKPFQTDTSNISETK